MIDIWKRRRSYTRATGHGRDSTDTTSGYPGAPPNPGAVPGEESEVVSVESLPWPVARV